MLKLWQHVTMLNSQHGNSECWFLHLVSPTHHANVKVWTELMNCGWGGEMFTTVLACILPQAQSHLQPRMHELVWSPPLPLLHTVYSWGWHLSRRQSYPHPRPHLLLLRPCPLHACQHIRPSLAELTPFCSSPQVPQSMNSWHISTHSELWMDSGPCETLAVATIEVRPFTLFAPLIADVPRPSDPNLRIHSRCVILPQQTS